MSRARTATDTSDVPDAVREAANAVVAELPHSGSALLIDMWLHLRDEGEVGARDLRDEAWPDDGYLAARADGKLSWWRSAGAPYLALLPSIVPPDDGGATWRFDEEGLDRPEVPNDPAEPPDVAVQERLRRIDGRAPDGGLTTASKAALYQMYARLLADGSASSDDLKHEFETSNYDQPQYGHWRSEHDWFREIGRGALAQLPGVDPPRVAGQEWRFVGVDR